MIYKRQWTIAWGYVIEIIGSAVVYGCTVLCFGVQRVTNFIQDTADEWNDLTGILFSASLAIWLTFINIRGSLFGDYLARKRGDMVYSRAFLTAMIACFVATVLLIACKGMSNAMITHLAFALLICSAINLVSMIKNATDLVRLYSAFKRELETEKMRLRMEGSRAISDID